MNNTIYIRKKDISPTYVGMMSKLQTVTRHLTDLPKSWPEFHCSIPLDQIHFIQQSRPYKWTQYRTFYVASENWGGHYLVHVKTKDPMIEYVTHANYYATYENLMAHVPDAEFFSKYINKIAIGLGCSVDKLMDDLRQFQSCNYEPISVGEELFYVCDKDFCLQRLLEYELFMAGRFKL